MTVETAATAARLWTIPISHYCEKARWALDRAGIDYVEHAHLQVLHWLPARLAGGGATVPVLRCPTGRVFDDSTDILHWVDEQCRRRGSTVPALFPEEAEARRAVAELERSFSEELGPAGRLWMYETMRNRADLVARYGVTGTPWWQGRFARAGYPLIRAIVRWRLTIDDDAVVRDVARVEAAFNRVDEMLADGRSYLVGGHFTAADLTWACMSAAVLMPEGYGVPLPRVDEMPTAAMPRVRAWRERPAGRFTLRLFAEERGDCHRVSFGSRRPCAAPRRH